MFAQSPPCGMGERIRGKKIKVCRLRHIFMEQKRKIIIIKEYTKQVMPNPVAYHSLTNAQPVPEQGAATPRPISRSFIAVHDTVWNGRTADLLLAQGHLNTKQCSISGFCHLVISNYLHRIFPLTCEQT